MTAPTERLVIAPGQRRQTIIGLIRSARRRLVLSIFRCDDDAVLRAIAETARRGVQVQAIVTGRARAAGRDLDAVQAFLVVHGIDVRRQSDTRKYHAKYMVADDATALIGSLNLTNKCFTRTCDFMLVTTDDAVVSGVSTLFEADWAGRPVTLAPAQAERLIIAPEHRPRERVTQLVRAARHRLRVIDAKFTDPHLLSLIASRGKAGINVAVAGRDDVEPLVAHGKLLIVDQETAVIGSLALNANAIETRRELAVVTHDARVIGQLDRFWCSLSASRRYATSARSVPGKIEEIQEMRP